MTRVPGSAWSGNDGAVIGDGQPSGKGCYGEAPPVTAPKCYQCGDITAKRSVGECCSSHRKELCHRCYRLTHFVEICGKACPKCAAEGLPVIYPPNVRVAPGVRP